MKIPSNISGDVAYPCWYVRLDDRQNIKKAKWVVGVYYDGRKEEHSIKLASIKNIQNQEIFDKITSLDFAMELLDGFRDEGKKFLEGIRK